MGTVRARKVIVPASATCGTPTRAQLTALRNLLVGAQDIHRSMHERFLSSSEIMSGDPSRFLLTWPTFGGIPRQSWPTQKHRTFGNIPGVGMTIRHDVRHSDLRSGPRYSRSHENSPEVIWTKVPAIDVLVVERTVSRGIHNHEDLIEVLLSIPVTHRSTGGLQVEVFSDRDTPRSQADIFAQFASAAVVIAPHGAGLVNIVMARWAITPANDTSITFLNAIHSHFMFSHESPAPPLRALSCFCSEQYCMKLKAQ